MKKLLTLIFALALTAGAGEFYFLKTKGDFETLSKGVEKAYAAAGYTMGDNRDMTGPYKKQFGKSHLAHYNLMTLHNPEHVAKIIVKAPNFGIFAPFSLTMYEKEGMFYAGFLRFSVMASIMEADNVDAELAAYEEEAVAILSKALPGAKEHEVAYGSKESGESYAPEFIYETDEDTDPDEVKEEIAMVFEGDLDAGGFVIANFNGLAEEMEEHGVEIFDFYDTYSICKLPVIYQVSQTRPEAGAFAPCSFAIYKLKGENEVKMTFPSVYNWIDRLNITDEKALDELVKAQGLIFKSMAGITE